MPSHLLEDQRLAREEIFKRLTRRARKMVKKAAKCIPPSQLKALRATKVVTTSQTSTMMAIHATASTSLDTSSNIIRPQIRHVVDPPLYFSSDALWQGENKCPLIPGSISSCSEIRNMRTASIEPSVYNTPQIALLPDHYPNLILQQQKAILSFLLGENAFGPLSHCKTF